MQQVFLLFVFVSKREIQEAATNVGVPIHFPLVFSYGAQDVHQGSVWTETVTGKIMVLLEVVAFRFIAPWIFKEKGVTEEHREAQR